MRPKILTVDDSKTIRLIVGRALKNFDCEVFEACNGVEGLDVATRRRPDLIILDITMPVMDGTEMLSKLKANPDLKSIPVIMLTAEAGRDMVLRIAKMGVRDYLIKPFKDDLLIDRVGRVIDLKRKDEVVACARHFDDPFNILVVDDKPAVIEQITAGLSSPKWAVHGRHQSSEAVDYCSRNLPDAILLSLSLPDNAGFALFQMFRASSKTKNVPVFGLCGGTALEDQMRAQHAGFNGVITKPIEFDELKLKISRALNLDAPHKTGDAAIAA